MENATKALLIAGSVLIAILLIAMGLRIFNSTSETTQQSQKAMDATAIATFNSQFNAGFSYNQTNEMERRNMTSVQVNTLLQKIKASNAVNKDYQINIVKLGIGEITNNKMYAMTLYDRNKDGYYDEVTIHP